MKLHTHDATLLLLHLPQALHDLMHHEDVGLVGAEFSKTHAQAIKNISAEQSLSAKQTDAPSSLISIEKSLDPMVQRSVQNIGLLLHDYMSQLSAFDVSNPEREKLLEHWREILLEQPQRLSTAKPSHWHDERSKAFWQEKLSGHAEKYGISPDIFTAAWDDWQRESGLTGKEMSSDRLQKMQQRQWQDLVMRARLHHETEKYHLGRTPSLTPYF